MYKLDGKCKELPLLPDTLPKDVDTIDMWEFLPEVYGSSIYEDSIYIFDLRIDTMVAFYEKEGN